MEETGYEPSERRSFWFSTSLWDAVGCCPSGELLLCPQPPWGCSCLRPGGRLGGSSSHPCPCARPHALEGPLARCATRAGSAWRGPACPHRSLRTHHDALLGSGISGWFCGRRV